MGWGIPKESQSKIFQLFFRAHPKKADGTGLGLSMVKNHVEKLGGSIEFESNEEGSSFKMIFPSTYQSEISLAP